MKNTISWEEWRAELEKQSSPDNEGWLTSREIMGILGFTLARVGDHLRTGVASGNVEAKKMKRVNVVGDAMWVACYRIKKKK